jgi:hypothetical protein
MVNSALIQGVELTREWLIAFISGLILRQTLHFRLEKCEKARWEEIR